MTTTGTATPTEVDLRDGPGAMSTADRVVRRLAIVAAVTDVALMALIGAVIPPLAIFAALTVIVLAAAHRRTRLLTVLLAVVALAANGGGLPFWSADLVAPADTIAFLWALFSAVSRFFVIAAALVSRRADAERLGRLLQVVWVGAMALGLVVTAVARAGVESDVAASGDVTYEIADFTLTDLTVTSGDTVLVTNEDPARHTFTVEGTDVDVELVGGQSLRVEVDLAPGTYEFSCTVPGHEIMRATLEVES